jgi:8-amino-7-oxononanoate synthase
VGHRLDRLRLVTGTRRLPLWSATRCSPWTAHWAPVAELHAAARSGSALLVLDEAHAFGVIGPGGRGAAAAAGIAAEPDLIRVVILSKALAGQGAAVLGAPEVIVTLVDTGRGFIFGTGLAPPCAGAALRLTGRASLTEDDFAAAARALAAVRDDEDQGGRR